MNIKIFVNEFIKSSSKEKLMFIRVLTGCILGSIGLLGLAFSVLFNSFIGITINNTDNNFFIISIILFIVGEVLISTYKQPK